MESSLRRVTLLVNPSARGVKPHFDPAPMVRYLERRGLAVLLECPATPAGATAAAAAAVVRGDDALFALGGDGTLRDAAEGLAGSNTALAALPGGTVNVWAREMGIPLRLRAAVDCHLAGQRVRSDVGLAGDRRFLLMASLGWDAEAARRVSPRLKRKVGDLAYIASFARLLPRLRPTDVEWRTGLISESHRAAIVVLSNTRLYGGRVEFSPEAVANDGLLDVAVLCPRGVGSLARAGFKVARNRISGDRDLLAFRSGELTVDTPGIPVQLDGDYYGDTPMRFSAEREALLVSVPAGPLPAVLVNG
jgi:YegS/Rv2252/BmrU family lipid kinase